MTLKRISVIAAAAILASTLAGAARQDKKKDAGAKSAKQAAKTAAPRGKLSQADLEKRFTKTLTGAVLKGSWQMTGEAGLAGKAPLSKPRDDKYTIVSVHKAEDDWWQFNARIEFGENDVTLPIRLQVKWAGDTAVITVDDVGFPGIGLYSARVMIYGNFYTGVWYGSNYGGIMSGQIVRAEDEKAAMEESDPTPKKSDRTDR